MRTCRGRRVLLRACSEPLEERQLLSAPVIDPVVDAVVPAGKSLIVPLTASDPEGDAVNWTVSSSDPAIVPTVHTGNPWLEISVDGYGEMVFQLLSDLAPKTVATIGGLAQSGFYDGLTFHRVIPGFVIQGGDPAGTGAGGPGFQFDDEFNAGAIFSGDYQLAMAKSSDDTNGSQFFVTLAQTRFLDFQHTIFGQLVRGSGVADAIAAVPRDANDKPLTPVVISSARYVQDSSDAVVTLASTGALANPATITLTATDATGLQTMQTFSVSTADDSGTNNNPFLGTILPGYTTPEGTAITIPLPYTDLEGSAVKIGAQYLDTDSYTNSTGVVNADHSLTITPNAGYTGPIRIAVGVSQYNIPFAYSPNDPNYSSYGAYWDTQAITIAVGDEPVTMTAEAVTAGAGEAVNGVANFTDADLNGAVGDYSGAVINWGDGNLTSDATITKNADGTFSISGSNTYAKSGSYPILVTLTSALGQIVQARATATVYDRRAGETTSVHLSGTLEGVAPDSTVIVRYQDGTTLQTQLDGSSGYALDHTFADDGFYDVSLTPVDSDVSAGLIRVLVDNVAPLAQISGTGSGGVGVPVALGLSAIDSTGDLAAGFTYAVDWNDGSPVQVVQGKMPSVMHTYVQEGSYMVSVVATDKDGGSSHPMLHALLIHGDATLAGTSGDDALYVRMTPDQTALEVRSGSVAGELLGSYAAGSLNSLEVNALAGTDTITLDVSNGLPTFVLMLDGGAGVDSLVITGLGGEGLTVSASSVTVGLTAPVQMSTETVLLDGAAGGAIDAGMLTVSTAVELAPAKQMVLMAQGLAITGAGSLDLGGNAIAVAYSGATPVQQVRQWVLNGRSGTTPALTNSAASGSGQPAVGYVDNALLHRTDFFGQALSGFSQVLVQSTVAGDVNLDGAVTAADYRSVIANMGADSAQWMLGDVNSDGVVGLDDYAEVTAYLGDAAAPGAPMASLSVVMESATAGPSVEEAAVETAPVTSAPAAAPSVPVAAPNAGTLRAKLRKQAVSTVRALGAARGRWGQVNWSTQPIAVRPGVGDLFVESGDVIGVADRSLW